jgi:hypothetical protein
VREQSKGERETRRKEHRVPTPYMNRRSSRINPSPRLSVRPPTSIQNYALLLSLRSGALRNLTPHTLLPQPTNRCCCCCCDPAIRPSACPIPPCRPCPGHRPRHASRHGRPAHGVGCRGRDNDDEDAALSSCDRIAAAVRTGGGPWAARAHTARTVSSSSRWRRRLSSSACRRWRLARSAARWSSVTEPGVCGMPKLLL